MKYVQQAFPLRLELRCYVNPGNPEEAVIERKAVVSWFAIGGGAMFLLAGVGIASYITYKLIEERRRTKGNGGSTYELQGAATSQLPSAAFAVGRRRLRGNPRGRSHTDWRWFALVMGVIITVIGVCIMLAAADVIPMDEGGLHVPRPVFFSVGLMFAIAGTVVGVRGWSNVRHHAKAKVSARDFPDEPWRIDRDWDRHESRAEGSKKVLATFAGGAFLFVFLIPFNYAAFFDEWSVFAQIIVGVFDGVLLWVWGYGVYLLMRQFKYGRSRIRFASFPFFAGKLFAVDWTVDKGLGEYHSIVFTLRCVEEVLEWGGYRNRSRTWVRYQTCVFTFEVDGPGRHLGGSAVPVAFPLPHGVGGTDMTAEQPRYWELEIHADTPGVDYRAIYLVPIYRAPRGATNGRGLMGGDALHGSIRT